MTIKLRINEDMKTAMRHGDKDKLSIIRMILAAVKQVEVDERIDVDDQRMLAILERMLKQRRESIEQYSQAKRQDLADKERFEISVIQTYLPPQLSDAEIHQLIDNAIQQAGATSMRDMAKVMAILKSQMQGRADMNLVSQFAKQKLS